jgi:hypothetical protein
VSTEGWVAWAIALGIAVIGVIIAVAAWRRPKAPLAPPTIPPDLRLQRIGPVASTRGAPRESAKTQLRLMNDGDGEASGWHVVFRKESGQGVMIAREPPRGTRHFADEIDWNQDASTGPVPAQQYRDLPGWLYVSAAPGTNRLVLPYVISAVGAPRKVGQLLVVFPSDPEGPDFRFT